MVSHTGPAGFALVLLCSMGTLLSMPIPASHYPIIIAELKALCARLLKEYRENGSLPSARYAQLSFSSHCRPPHHINSTAIRPYFTAIKRLQNNANIEKVVQQLNKIEPQNGMETTVPVPAGAFNSKRFILTVLQEFSACLQLLSARSRGPGGRRVTSR